MKQRIYNGHSLEFYNEDNSKKGELRISGSDIVINPMDSDGTVIFGEEGSINDIEVGASGTPVNFTFLGGGTLTSNGGTLTLGVSGDTVDLSNATIGTVTASIFKGGQFIGDGSGLTGVPSTFTHITASGNISASGEGYFSKVGVGTTAPGHLLEVRGTGDALSVGDDTNTQTYMRFANERTQVGYSGANAVFQGGLSKGIRFNVNNNSFNSGNAMAILADGNVGIGTTSPGAKLDVNGDATITGSFSVDSNTAFSLTAGSGDTLLLTNDSTTSAVGAIGPTIGFGNMNTNRRTSAIGTTRTGDDHDNMGLAFFTHAGDGNDETIVQQMTIAHDGKVGIGTTTPSEPLTVEGNVSASGTIKANGGTLTGNLVFTQPSDIRFANGQIIDDNGSGGLRIYTPQHSTDIYSGLSGNLRLFTSQSVERLRIDNAGNVGIGTTTSTKKLTVAGTISASANITAYGDITATGSIKATGAVHGADLELPSGGIIDWANGDARIVEGETNNYSLTFKTYDGSGASSALRLDGNNNATFTGHITASGNISASGNIFGKKFGSDTNNLIDFSTDNQITVKVNNVAEYEFAENVFRPTTTDGAALGDTNHLWSDLFLRTGAVINFNQDDVLLTHSADTLTMTGGTFVAEKATIASLTVTSLTSSIVTSSILLTEGSNTFGDAASDSHRFTGSIFVSSSGTIGPNSAAGIEFGDGTHGNEPTDITIFTANGGEIHLKRGGNLKLSVQDNGIDIDEEVHVRDSGFNNAIILSQEGHITASGLSLIHI